MNEDGRQLNADCADDADARRSVKIRAISVIRVLRRDGGAVSCVVAGIAKVCEFCALCGEISE